jgi:hypothetical protein
VKKFLAVVVLGALALLVPGTSHAAKRPAPAYAGTCGLPTTSPLWIDYGWPDLAAGFEKPGVILTSTGLGFTQQIKQAGIPAVFFDLNFKNRVGQPATPADPSTIADRANRLFDYAAAQVECSTPTIVENELFGAGLVTPWSETNAKYRQNVLVFLQTLAARGAHPVLLVNSTPYTAGEALTWWQQVAQVADIVRESYVPATAVWKAGPIVGNRMLRQAYRRGLQDFLSIGIPPQKLGFMVSFSTTTGFGGRNGLQPLDAWLQVAKWQALAARSVAAELGAGSIWSWGWGEWSDAEKDPDKPAAACVWLWARNPALCDGPLQGVDFDTSRTEGQLTLAPDIECTVGGRALSNGAIQKLQLMTGDRDTAFSALYERLVESKASPVSTAAVLKAERYVIQTQFKGSRGAYLGALGQVHANLTIARGVLGDELRRARIEATLPAATPSETEVQTFYTSYPDVLARSVQAKQEASWLGAGKKGLIISAVAPELLFSGGARTIWTPLGSVAVKPLGASTVLGAVPLALARPAIVNALKTFARGEAFERWTEKQQQGMLATTICARDDLPQPSAVELSTYLPFLRL